MQPVNNFFSLETLAIITVFIFLISYTVLYRQNRLLIHDNDRFVENSNALQHMSNVFMLNPRFEDAVQVIVDDLREHLKADIAGIYLAHQTGKTVHLAASSGISKTTIDELRYLKQDEAFIGSVFAGHQSVFAKDLISKPRLTNSAMKRDDWSSLCAVPIIYRDDILGVLFAVRKNGSSFNDDHAKFMVQLGQMSGAPIKAAIIEAALKRHMVRDKITNLYTRPAFDRYLRTEILRSERFARMLSIVLVDIDSFSEFRQVCGDQAVKYALRDIGRLITGNTRLFDIGCRYEDSMFAILLPETDAEGSQIVAERLQQVIAKAVFDNGKGERVLKLTASLSVATYPFVMSQMRSDEKATKSEQLFQVALDALGRAKLSGTGKITSAMA